MHRTSWWDTSLKSEELANHKISIVPDAKLASLAEGNIPDEVFIQNIDVPIILKKNERVAFILKEISYCEERRQRYPPVQGDTAFALPEGSGITPVI